MIYFIQDGEDGPIKIGYSDDVFSRIKRLSTETHKNLRILLVVGGKPDQEWQLQQRFSFAHKKGEWFWPVNELLDFIEGYTLSTVEPPTNTIPAPKRHRGSGGRHKRPIDEQKICQLHDKGLSLRGICWEALGQKAGGRQVLVIKEILRRSGRI